jgi:hypothetical protein
MQGDPIPAMKPRTFLNIILTVGVLLGLFWWGWQTTTPDIVVAPSAPTQGAVKSPASQLVPSANTPMPVPQNVAMIASDASDSVAPPSESLNNSDDPHSPNYRYKDLAIQARAAYDYAMAHKGDPSMPKAVYARVPLDQAEHHVFHLTTDAPGGTSEVSIGGYGHLSNGLDTVTLHVWANNGVSTWGDLMNLPLTDFSPDDQDYIRNWARQHAATNPDSTSQTSAPWPTLPQLRQEANQLGISIQQGDWIKQVQAQMQANSAETTQANQPPNPESANSSASSAGPTIITN